MFLYEPIDKFSMFQFLPTAYFPLCLLPNNDEKIGYLLKRLEELYFKNNFRACFHTKRTFLL